MKEIKFSYNNKLDCKAFTTIRLYQPLKYVVGEKYNILLKNQTILFQAEIVSIKKFMLDTLDEFISYVDTGYSIDECTEIILRMYPKVDFSKQILSLILLKRQPEK